MKVDVGGKKKRGSTTTPGGLCRPESACYCLDEGETIQTRGWVCRVREVLGEWVMSMVWIRLAVGFTKA